MLINNSFEMKKMKDFYDKNTFVKRTLVQH